MKRFFDVFASGLGILVLSPLFLIIAIWIKLDSEGPVFYRQVRVGKDNKDFRYCVFINKAQLGLRNIRAMYMNLGRTLTKKGLPMLPDMVSHSDRMMTIDKVDIIRSTFGYPDFDSPAFTRSRDLGIQNLFIDVTRELAATEDQRRTAPSDLTFIEGLEKQNDGRCFTGSAFPQYEL